VVFAVLPIRGRWLRLLIVLILALVVLTLALAVFVPLIDLMNNAAGPSGRK
jgi:type II secretory pathway component PulF